MMHYYESTNSTKFISNLQREEMLNLSKEQILTKTIGNKDTVGIWAVWRHVYRRDLIQETNLFFDVCYAYAEDLDWFIQVMLKSEVYGFFQDPISYYRYDNESSVSNQYSLRSVCNHIEILAKWIKFFEQSNLQAKNKKAICERLSNKLMAITNNIGHLEENDLKVAIAYLRQYQSSLAYVSGAKFKGAYYVSKVIGLSNTAKLLSKVSKP